MNKIISKPNIMMNDIDLQKLSKTELINIIRGNNTIDVRPGYIRSPKTNRWIKINGPTFKKLRPIPAPRKPTSAPKPKPRPIIKLNSAFKDATKSFEVRIKSNDDPMKQLEYTRNDISKVAKNELFKLKGYKYKKTLKVTFKKQMDSENMVYKSAYFQSRPQTVTNENDIQSVISLSSQEIINIINQWISEGSGWVVDSVNSNYINLTYYNPLKGSSYIELPTELRHGSKKLINMQNIDEKCFMWCHIRHLNKQDKNPQKIKKSDRKFVDQLNYEGIKFPVDIKQYNKIEKQNNTPVNVFGYEDEQPFPLYISKEKFKDCMNLLLITKDDETHYVLISDFNSFMYSKTKHREKKHFCLYCLQCFSSERVLESHMENCITINGKQAINMPSEDDKILQFQNFHKQLDVPFVIYAGFEAITEKIQMCELNNKKSFTEAYQRHVDCGFGYKVVCRYDNKYGKPIKIYRGENATYKFMEEMLREVRYCTRIKNKHFKQDMIMTKQDKVDHKKAKKCHICNKEYINTDYADNNIVRDHCHVTGKYGGSAHTDCNFRLTDKVPVIFHNLRGYDNRFIMQQIGEILKKHSCKTKYGELKEMDINVIPNNMEKYMAFMLGDYIVSVNMQRLFEDLLYKYRVDLAFWAHYHAYERTCKLYKGKCTEDGILHLIVGTGGKDVDADVWYDKDWSIFRSNDYGYGRVTVSNYSAILFEWIQNRSKKVVDSVWLLK
ncbi:uncharacterized protein LOC130645009 isoform X1 [Hydractinia symbiolongicarpus]|uniref:uncharacterized protein LOC130645009 isoform X1 n=1 Tax=Hydractinia symbiolongicarpus TaxID=13093 RepID=UPI00254D7B85|nr:uncharacterized protein LOC130645009 isoform X1 [Hydractinia symbiolongicarpus]